jgi:hypothetical protein
MFWIFEAGAEADGSPGAPFYVLRRYGTTKQAAETPLFFEGDGL